MYGMFKSLPMGALVVVLLALMAPAIETQAQGMGDLTQYATGNVAYYRYAKPGDVTIEVNIWGAVVKPGLYEVVEGTPLNTLLTLAGGPPLGLTQVATERTTRILHLRLMRPEGGRMKAVFDKTMENGIIISEENPVLQNGDYLTVELTEVRKHAFSWRDVISVGTIVAVIAQSVYYFSN